MKFLKLVFVVRNKLVRLLDSNGFQLEHSVQFLDGEKPQQPLKE